MSNRIFEEDYLLIKTNQMIVVIIAEILQVFSNGGHGTDYWRYCFPAFVLGSAGAVMTFFASA